VAYTSAVSKAKSMVFLLPKEALVLGALRMRMKIFPFSHFLMCARLILLSRQN
jgi:hypothetical protein